MINENDRQERNDMPVLQQGANVEAGAAQGGIAYAAVNMHFHGPAVGSRIERRPQASFTRWLYQIIVGLCTSSTSWLSLGGLAAAGLAISWAWWRCMDFTAHLKHRYQQLEPESKLFELNQPIDTYYQELEIKVEQPDFFTPDGTGENGWKKVGLAEVYDSASALILTGEMGSGKTTWCQQLVKSWAGVGALEAPAWLLQFDNVLYIPLRLLFQKINSDDTQEEEMDKIKHWTHYRLWSLVLERSIPRDEPVPSLSNTLLVLDGFDEVVSTNEGSLAWQVLGQLLTPDLNEQRHIILTMRSQVYISRYFKDFIKHARLARIEGLSKISQAAFIEQYFGDRRENPADVDSLLLKDGLKEILNEQPILAELQYHPLLLKMLCWLYGFPGTRRDLMQTPTLTGIYETVIERLIHRWQQKASTHYFAPNKQGELYTVLSSLADQDETIIERQRVMDVLRQCNIAKEKYEAVLIDLSQQGIGLLKPIISTSQLIDGDWEFLHFSFHEYFRGKAWAKNWLSLDSGIKEQRLMEQLAIKFQSQSLLPRFTLGHISQSASVENFNQTRAGQCVEAWLAHWLVALLPEEMEMPGEYGKTLVELGIERLQAYAIPQNINDNVEEWLRELIATLQWSLVEWSWDQFDRNVRERCIFSNRLPAFYPIAYWGGKKIGSKLLDKLPVNQRMMALERTNLSGWTVFMVAASRGHIQFAQWLLSRLSKPNQMVFIKKMSHKGVNALMLTALEGHVEFAKKLLSPWLKREPEALRKSYKGYGWTLLMLTAIHGHVEFGKWLLLQLPKPEWGDFIKLKDNQGRTALMLAAIKGGHAKFGEWLLSQLPAPDRPVFLKQLANDRSTALMLAAYNGHADFGEWLLSELSMRERIEMIKQTDEKGRTALVYAAEKDHALFVKLLVSELAVSDRTMFINQGEKEHNCTALMLAAIHGHMIFGKHLLSQLPKRDYVHVLMRKDNNGWTALILAVSHGHIEFAEWLLLQLSLHEGIELLNQQDNNGWTVYKHAESKGHTEFIKFLRSHQYQSDQIEAEQMNKKVSKHSVPQKSIHPAILQNRVLTTAQSESHEEEEPRISPRLN